MKSWNKGLTKLTHPSLYKTSLTLARKERSNFWQWQQLHKPNYATIQESKTLAELYGTLLGDGCIEKLARTDKLTISFNRKETAHIDHVHRIIFKVLKKEAKMRLRKHARCNDLYIYQKFLHKRLKFPYGKKLDHKLDIPSWIRKNNIYTKHCLKGLFETDGDWVIDKKNSTNVIKFNNHSDSLLDRIYQVLCAHGYHPQRRKYDIRLARQKEVCAFVEWIKFRQY